MFSDFGSEFVGEILLFFGVVLLVVFVVCLLFIYLISVWFNF